MADNAPIGIFDSGIGGLTVVKEVVQLMPGEDIIYFGDTARVPYGPRPPLEITRFMNEILHFLLANKIKIAVVACNTMTTVAMESVKKRYSLDMVGVNFGVQPAIKASRNCNIGVIATQATIASGMHGKAIKAYDPFVSVFPQACPKFVPLIEQGKLEGKEIEEAAWEYLQPLKEAQVDALILGCTHYPIIEPVIKRIMGANTVLVDPAKETAYDAYTLLKGKNKFADRTLGSVRLCFSGEVTQPRRMAEFLLDTSNISYEQVNLNDFC